MNARERRQFRDHAANEAAPSLGDWGSCSTCDGLGLIGPFPGTQPCPECDGSTRTTNPTTSTRAPTTCGELTRFGFSGTREGMTFEQRQTVADKLTAAAEFHHGDCVGADDQAHDLVPEHCHVVVHPGPDPARRAFRGGRGHEVLPPKPFLERNHDIVDATETLIAAPLVAEADAPRSGTWATVRYAVEAGRKVVVVWPDGSWEHR